MMLCPGPEEYKIHGTCMIWKLVSKLCPLVQDSRVIHSRSQSSVAEPQRRPLTLLQRQAQPRPPLQRLPQPRIACRKVLYVQVTMNAAPAHVRG